MASGKSALLTPRQGVGKLANPIMWSLAASAFAQLRGGGYLAIDDDPRVRRIAEVGRDLHQRIQRLPADDTLFPSVIKHYAEAATAVGERLDVSRASFHTTTLPQRLVKLGANGPSPSMDRPRTQPANATDLTVLFSRRRGASRP